MPKYLYAILTNKVYIGKIVHKDNVWESLHDPIIDQELWDRVHNAIDTREHQIRHRWSHTHLLKRKLKTFEGSTMGPSSVPQYMKDGEKFHVLYYTSQKAMKQGYKTYPIKTINAKHLDDLIRALVLDHLNQHELLGVIAGLEPQVRDHLIRAVLHCVHLAPDELMVELDAAQIEACRHDPELKASGDQQTDNAIPRCLHRPEIEEVCRHVVLTLTMQIKKHDGKRMLLSPDGHDLVMPANGQCKPHIVQAIGQAYDWHKRLGRKGMKISKLAEEIGLSEARIHKLLPLTYLAPDILKQALTGQLPPSMTLADLLAAAAKLTGRRSAFLNLPSSNARR